ncbi:MAG: internalin A [Parvicella sp.]|jgi:internalin A
MSKFKQKADEIIKSIKNGESIDSLKSRLASTEDDWHRFSSKAYNVSDQTRSGASESGLQSGELDLMIRKENGIPLTIVESLRLKSCGSKNKIIAAHINKLFTKYDTHGLERNFMLVFGESQNFQSLCKNYFQYVGELNSKIGFDEKKFPITRVSLKPDLSESANIKIAISYHLHNSETRELVHIILNMK